MGKARLRKKKSEHTSIYVHMKFRLNDINMNWMTKPYMVSISLEAFWLRQGHIALVISAIMYHTSIMPISTNHLGNPTELICSEWMCARENTRAKVNECAPIIAWDALLNHHAVCDEFGWNAAKMSIVRTASSTTSTVAYDCHIESDERTKKNELLKQTAKKRNKSLLRDAWVNMIIRKPCIFFFILVFVIIMILSLIRFVFTFHFISFI